MNNAPQRAHLVAQGWILMFLLFICIFVSEFLGAVISGNLSIYTSDEGAAGLKLMTGMMLLHAFVPMLVCSFDARWFRWAVAVLTLLFGLIMMGHEISHLFVIKNREFGRSDLLDLAHHALSLWVAAIAVQWARAAGAPAGLKTVRPPVLG